ncbi:MAG TPA: DNA polymerase III subunit delta [Candidatus Saccharimonadales bacterium]|jgi:DNA polymerase-3 subunit delta
MIIYLYGQDTFRSRRKLEELKTKFRREIDVAGFNLEVLDGATLTISAFTAAVGSVPFMAKKRMVVVEQLFKNRRKELQAELLLRLQRLDEQTILIFWEAQAPEKRKSKKAAAGKTTSTSLNDLLVSQKFAQRFDLLTPPQVQTWAKTEIQKLGGQVSPDGLRLLADYVGHDLWRLQTEIEKLVAAAQRQEISRELVAEHVRSPIEDNIFALTDAVAAGQRRRSLKLLNDQLALGAHPLELLSKLTWQFRNLLLIKSFTQAHGGRYSADRIGTQLGLHPFVVRKILPLAAHYRLDHLKKTYRQLLAADQRLKTSQTEPHLLLDLLLVQSAPEPAH